MLLYCLTFTPTIALTNSIALQQTRDPEKDFASIRVFGTIAWIFIVNVVGFYGFGDQVAIFYLSLIFSLLLGMYGFFLPDTPPSSKGPVSFGQIIGKDAFVLFKDRSYAFFFISSILVCIPLSFYYTWSNPSITDSFRAAFPSDDPSTFKVENLLSLGQISEVLFMLILPFFYKKLGIKKIILVALFAWVVRFLLFGYGDASSGIWMFYIAILLHGICYDFFFVSGQIYTDNKAGAKIKSQAQGLIFLATYGIGMFIGSLIAGRVKDNFTSDLITDWTYVWVVPSVIAAVLMIMFMAFFKEKEQVPKREEVLVQA
jgi:nucleoside transporter